jgi:beta-glucosidase/6-phospho-beta-glucosidase/beta-galactosidase
VKNQKKEETRFRILAVMSSDYIGFNYYGRPTEAGDTPPPQTSMQLSKTRFLLISLIFEA